LKKIKYQKEISFKSLSEIIFYLLESFILKIIIESWEGMPPAVFQIPQEEFGIYYPYHFMITNIL
jgi:hypothetical protein